MPVDVFISYHVSTSKYIADAVCHSLESAGIRVWYAPRDVHNFYANDIADAIRQCKVFLLLLNAESSYSEDCLNEIQLGFQRIRERENMAFLPFQVFPGDISPSAKYYLSRMNWIDAITPPLDVRIQELTAKITGLLSEEHKLRFSFWKQPGDADFRQETIQKKDSNIRRYIPVSNGNFVGRHNELITLHSMLENKRYAFVSGIGGIGKSEFVKKYIEQYQAQYEQIVWTSCNRDLTAMIADGGNLLKEVFPRIEKDGVQETDDEYVQRKLHFFQELISEKTLWIIDNFDYADDKLLDEVIRTDCRIIFTTRNDYEYEGYPTLKLEALSEEDGTELFQKYYKGRMSSDDKSAFLTLFNSTDGHTLAIELFAKIAASRHMTPVKLLESYNNHGLADTFSNRIRSGSSGYANAFDYVKDMFKAEELSEEDKRILLHMTLLPVEGYFYSEFAELAGIENYEAIDELIRRSWIKYDPAFDMLYMHPLIREVVIEKLPNDRTYFSDYIINLGKKTENAWFMNYEEKLELSHLVLRVFERFEHLSWELREAYRNMAFLMVRLEKHECVESIVKEFLQIHVDRYGEEAAETILPRYRMADFYFTWSQLETAYEILEKDVRIAQKAAPDSKDTAYIEKYLSWIYLGEYVNQSRVAELLDDCERILKLLYGDADDEPQLASLNAAKATLYSQTGQYDKGLEAAEQSYRVYHKLSGDENADTLAPMAIRSLLLSQCGRTEEGVALLSRVIEIQKHLFGENHAKVIARYETMARIYIAAKDKDNAMLWLAKCMDCLREKSGTNSKLYRRCEQLMTELNQ